MYRSKLELVMNTIMDISRVEIMILDLEKLSSNYNDDFMARNIRKTIKELQVISSNLSGYLD